MDQARVLAVNNLLKQLSPKQKEAAIKVSARWRETVQEFELIIDELKRLKDLEYKFPKLPWNEIRERVFK